MKIVLMTHWLVEKLSYRSFLGEKRQLYNLSIQPCIRCQKLADEISKVVTTNQMDLSSCVI